MTRLCTALLAVVAVAAVCEAMPPLIPRPTTGAAGRNSMARAISSTSDEPAGKAVYAKTCEACHGPQGSGGTAPALVPFTLELSELLTIVRQGIGVMPGISRDRVSDDDLSAIRDYLISLKS